MGSAPRFALVVGETQYSKQHSYVGQDWGRLDVAKRDAEAMASRLAASGFTVMGGSAQFDLSRAAFMANLSALADRARSQGAIVLVYVSGHGFTDHGQTYFSPVDGPRPVLGVPFAAAEYIDVGNIQDALSGSNPLLQIILIDACRDALPSYGPISGKQDVLRRNTVLGLAGEAGAAVSAPLDAKLSAYTSALLDSLSSSDGERSLFTMLLDTDLAVAEVSGGEQVPVFRLGEQNGLDRLRASAVFGTSKTAFASAERIATDRMLLSLAAKLFDIALSCDFRGPRGKTPISSEVQGYYGLFLLGSVTDDDRARKCRELGNDVDLAGSRLPEEARRRIDAKMAANAYAIIKQMAQQGDAHANLQVFAAIYDRADLLFGREDAFKGYLTPGDRTAFEYAFRAADAGDPMAQLLVGQVSMPYIRNGEYFSVLPGDISGRYEVGRSYLERALKNGIGDAGLILAVKALYNLSGLDTHPELYRNYVERAIAAPIIIFTPGYVQAAKYNLAIDYIDAETGPKDATRGIALLREIVASAADDSEQLSGSARGFAAWRLAFILTRGVRANLPVESPVSADLRRFADVAAGLGIREAMLFVGKSRVRGLFGYPKDIAGGEAMVKAAAGSKVKSNYTVSFPGE